MEKNIDKNIKKIQIGKQFQSIRRALGLTQEQVAEKLELAPRYISDIERNKTKGSLDTFVKLCNIYNVSPSFVLKDYIIYENSSSDVELIGYNNLNNYEKAIIKNLIQFMNSQK